jgi:putative phosphoribosyl transferase
MFKDREEAGRRGGVVVGKELAKALDCSLDVLVTKKIGAPGNPELAIGAIGPDGTVVLNQDLVPKTGADKEYISKQQKAISEEVKRKMKAFRKGKRRLNLKGKAVILTDDGIATGATVEASIKWIKTQKPKKVILAVPVAAPDSLAKLAPLVDEVVCLDQPYFFAAVGQFYQSFPQTTDEEVIEMLGGK